MQHKKIGLFVVGRKNVRRMFAIVSHPPVLYYCIHLTYDSCNSPLCFYASAFLSGIISDITIATTNTPATGFPAKISPTIDGK